MGRWLGGVCRLAFEADRALENGSDVSNDVAWAVCANQVLRSGSVLPIEEIAHEFYDILHILALDRNRPADARRLEEVFEGYPGHFRERVRSLLHQGVPRNRFLHNCLGLCERNIYILQREGTVEEVANWLREAGASDGFILDNGGSPFCWTWWPYPKGGFLFSAPDYRPNASAVLVFVLHGPAKTALPSGSVSYSVC